MKVSRSIMLCLALAIPALTQNQPTVTVVATFPGNALIPFQLIQGAGGNFYGVTSLGGHRDLGTIFRMTPQGNLSRVFTFNGANGTRPQAALVQGRGGNFYGTTSQGGASGQGTIFKMSRAGTLQTLHSFVCHQANCPDGDFPDTKLVRGLDGSYYGTTYVGGSADKGVVFRIGPHGSFVVLHSFGYPTRKLGAYPRGPLLQASDGNLYGTCERGGAYGLGTIFMVTPQGQVKLFHTFGPLDTEGDGPAGDLVQGSDGNLYGSTEAGGANQWGTLFKINLQGDYQKIYDFASGSFLYFRSLLQASDGNLWGVFKGYNIYVISTSGLLVQNIDMLAQGVAPISALMQGSDGKLYAAGDDINHGDKIVILAIDAGLPPPAPSIAGFRPLSGTAGSEVVISGASYVGATGVVFNGVSAQFVVNASGVITATVPVGASSGPIQVTTPGGSAASQTDFTVLP